MALGPAPAGAQSNPYERGPAPTATSVTQQRGPFAYTQTTVTGSSALGFNRGTIYYPTDASQTYGAIAAIPGFVSPESFISWTGPFLASNGFVVMTLEPFSGFDMPASRATQLQKALDDFIAPPGSNAEVFYQQIPAASEKAYLEVGSGTHFLGNVFNVEQARSTLSWFKRYIDDDTRYSPFLCPQPSGGLIAEYRHTCPD